VPAPVIAGITVSTRNGLVENTAKNFSSPGVASIWIACGSKRSVPSGAASFAPTGNRSLSRPSRPYRPPR